MKAQSVFTLITLRFIIAPAASRGRVICQPLTHIGFVFGVCKQKLSCSAGWLSPPAAYYLRCIRAHSPSRAGVNRSLLKMQVSSVLASPQLLLQLCISTVHYFLSSFFSRVRNWTAGASEGTTSPVTPADSKLDQSKAQHVMTPTSVNYHFTRQCNYKCGFCFHTAKTSFVLPLEEAKRGLQLLQESGNCHKSV